MAKETYEVIGTSAYQGVKPGDSFTADLPDDVRERAIARGSIAVKGGGKKAKQKSESLEGKKRAELDEIAKGLGVNEPEKLKNSAEVISAIRSYNKE